MGNVIIALKCYAKATLGAKTDEVEPLQIPSGI